MKTYARELIGIAAVLAAVSVTSANAQSAFSGSDVAEERNEDLREEIERDAERELDRFGNTGREQGFTGSIALRGIATSGNTDTATLGIGANFEYVDGPNGYDVQLNYTYSEEDGTTDEKSLFYGLEYTRDINDNLFGFGKLQGSVDEFSSYSTDQFVSAGIGYRVVNTPTTQWSVQAGPGYRVAEFNIVAPDISEVAFGVSSDFSHRVNDSITITNDTDIISSESDTMTLNDLAISVAISQQLALRTSLLTEHHSDPAPGFSDTDNTFGVSLVYNLK